MTAATDTRTDQLRFLTAVFGDESGYLFVSTLDHGARDRGETRYWVDTPFAWPALRNDMLEYIAVSDAERKSVYVSCQLYRTPDARKKHLVKVCPSAWSDLDAASPSIVDPRPSVAVESSPGRYQGYWRAAEPLLPHVAEDVSKRIAYAYHQHGADLGGWDLTQVLRIPGTHNYKYADAPVVKLLTCDPTPLPRRAFDRLPQAPHKETAAPLVRDGREPPVDLLGFDLETWQQEEAPDRSAWAQKMVGILKNHGLADHLVELSLTTHPIYVSKARGKWGSRESLIIEDIRRCIKNWRDHPQPQLRIPDPSGHPRSDTETGELPPEFVVSPADEFLQEVMPELSFIVPGHIGDEAIVIFYGATATLKTYVITDLALAVATGRDWCGSFETAQGVVLVIQEDTPKPVYQQRYLRPMVQQRRIDPATLHDTLYVAAANGFLLDVPARVHQLEQWLALYRPRLVILDAFYLLHQRDTKDETELVAVLRTLRELRDVFHCAFAVIDHSRKGSTAKTETDPIDDLYGGQAKGANSDGLIQFLRVKGEKSCTYMAVRKVRGDVQPDPVRLRLTDGLLRVDGAEDETESGSERIVRSWLLREGGTRTYKQISNGVNLSVRTVTSTCHRLEERRLLIRGKSGSEITYLAVERPISEEEADDVWPR